MNDPIHMTRIIGTWTAPDGTHFHHEAEALTHQLEDHGQLFRRHLTYAVQTAVAGTGSTRGWFFAPNEVTIREESWTITTEEQQ